MKVQFQKMNGAGNDFIMVDNRSGGIQVGPTEIKALCERRRGIGADGMILLESAAGVDFVMRYYNADGSEAEMCGNGARCAALFAASLGAGQTDNGVTHLHFLTQPGVMDARVEASRVAISMTDATDFEKSISLSVANGEEIVHFINSGVPHAVVVEPNAPSLSPKQVIERGRSIRMHGRFEPGGANANFAAVMEDGVVALRTYERGVEDETLACGTGAVATAVVFAHLGKAESPVSLLTAGGETLTVSFEKITGGARNVVLEGPAAVNFVGTVDIG